MSLINQTVNCGKSVDLKNWGQGTCLQGRRELEKGFFFSPSPFFVNAAGLIDFPDWLDDNLHATTMNERVQYFGGLKEITNNDADPTTYDFADGSQTQTRDRKYRRMYRVDSDCLHRAVRSWNDQSGYIMWVDKDGGLDGVKGLNAGEQVIFAAPVSRIFAEDVILPTMAEVAAYNVTIELTNVEDVNTNHVHISKDKVRDGDGNEYSILANVQELVMQEALFENTNSGTPGSGIFDIGIFSGACEENNLVIVFGATLASSSMYVVSNNATGGVIPPTTVALGINNERIRFTLPTGNANYPASGGAIRIRQVQSAWTAAGVVYYEADPIIIQIP